MEEGKLTFAASPYLLGFRVDVAAPAGFKEKNSGTKIGNISDSRVVGAHLWARLSHIRKVSCGRVVGAHLWARLSHIRKVSCGRVAGAHLWARLSHIRKVDFLVVDMAKILSPPLSPPPKRSRYGIGTFALPMALNVLHEDVTGLPDVGELGEQTVRCLSQEERKSTDPEVRSRDFVRLDKMERAATSLAWKQHLLHNEVDVFKTILCVEAIKFLEETFSGVLQSLAPLPEHQSTASQLSSVMKESAIWLKQNPSETIWIDLSFSVFCFGILQILNCSRSNPVNEDVADLLSETKVFFMEVLNQSLNSVVERSRSADVLLEEETMSHIEAMRKPDNFVCTVQEWAVYAGKRHERNCYAHPWLLLNQAEKKIYMRDFEITLENSFSLNIRGIGHLARLALKTQDAEHGAEELKQKKKKESKVLNLITLARKEHNTKEAAKVEAQMAADTALEEGQFRDFSFE